MTKKEFLRILKDLKDDEHMNLLAWDGNDTWEINRVSLNKYDSGENDLEFIMNKDYSIVNSKNFIKAIERIEKDISNLDISDSNKIINYLSKIKSFII